MIDQEYTTFATNIPNRADDELDPYEYRLYGHHLRIQNCDENIWLTAEKTHMSAGKVSITRRKLYGMGYLDSFGWKPAAEMPIIPTKQKAFDNHRKRQAMLKRGDPLECHYCGAPLYIEDELLVVGEEEHHLSALGYRQCSVDHKVPLCRGGTNDLDNLVLCCLPCNLKKGRHMYEDFVNSPYVKRLRGDE